MGVQHPFGVIEAVIGGLVEAHRVGEGDFEQVVVANGDFLVNIGQGAPFGLAQGGEVLVAGENAFATFVFFF